MLLGNCDVGKTALLGRVCSETPAPADGYLVEVQLVHFNSHVSSSEQRLVPTCFGMNFGLREFLTN